MPPAELSERISYSYCTILSVVIASDRRKRGNPAVIANTGLLPPLRLRRTGRLCLAMTIYFTERMFDRRFQDALHNVVRRDLGR